MPRTRPQPTDRLIPRLFRNRGDLFQVLTLLEIQHALKDCSTVLDVGCGNASPISLLGIDFLVGIDGYEPSVKIARETRTHDQVVLGDVRDLESQFKPGQFEACVAIDVIEHLTPEEGIRLARSMEVIASKRVVFFTPNGFLHQEHTEDGDLQEHHSGWSPADMRKLGYTVRGMLGPAGLRGENHRLKHRPRAFWGLVSLLGQLAWTRHRPDHAAAILCSKSLRQ